MNKNLLNEAKKIIRQRRDIAEEAREKAQAQLMDNPEYSRIHALTRRQIIEISKASALGIDTTKAEEEHASTLNRLRDIENQLKIDSNPHYCKLCSDTGQNPDGSYCACLKNVYNDLIRRESGMSDIPDFTFNDNRIDAINCPQQYSLSVLYEKMQNYCDEFPNNKQKNLLLLGNVGVGKSCLVSAVANDLIRKNKSVQLLTAFGLNNLLLKYHTSDIAMRYQYMDSLLECDLLIIDDLGTEPILKNVTLEYLFSILDSRVNKHTIITSNLTLIELLDRYKERIFSRITNKATTSMMNVQGIDLRLKR